MSRPGNADESPDGASQNKRGALILKLYLPVLILCLLFNLITGVSYPSARLENPSKIGPGLWIGDGGTYYGALSVFGWPLGCFAMREEAKSTVDKSDMRIVAVRFSLIAAALDIAVWMAPLLIVRSLRPNSRLTRARRLTTCAVAIVLLVLAFALRERSFLDPIPIYPDQAHDARASTDPENPS